MASNTSKLFELAIGWNQGYSFTMELPTEESFASLVESLRQESLRLQDKEARALPLPPLLFHATKKGNLNRILTDEGLKPSGLIFEDVEVVSLSDDPEFALEVAQKTQGVSRNKLAVVWVDTSKFDPELTDNYLRKEDLSAKRAIDRPAIHEVHYRGPIPKEWLADEAADLSQKPPRKIKPRSSPF